MTALSWLFVCLDVKDPGTFDPKAFWKAVQRQEWPFEALAAHLWSYQRQHNPYIKAYVAELEETMDRLPRPYLTIPIDFFKYAEMKIGQWAPAAVFESSGTTGQTPSRHYVRDLSLYQQLVLDGFRAAFPDQAYRILALLPSYLERGNSSLVYMVKTWMDEFGLPGSGFYLDNMEALQQAMIEGAEAREPLLVIGVTYALLDFVAAYPTVLPPDTIVMETGGMKGRKREMVRSEVHDLLKKGLGLAHIYSEYGMTELMSQAYTGQDGRFRSGKTMQVMVSDIHLPTRLLPPGRTGRLHVVDLANIHSCAFIATDDLGRMHEDGSFEVLGRIDTAELRGCNLMYVG